jgi:ABC-type ATPase with predicted acetyltransferase domain
LREINTMPVVSVSLSSSVPRTFRVAQIAGMFGLAPQAPSLSLAAEVPGADEAWTIGAIVGPSGSGKTSLARVAFPHAVASEASWPRDQALVDGLGERPIQELARVLTAVGLGSVPTWLKPYHVLSTGERFRADAARALVAAAGQAQREPDRPAIALLDEFTASLDRQVACMASAALARLLRRAADPGLFAAEPREESPWRRVRLVAVGCHDDVLAWLAPDWVLHLAPGGPPRRRAMRPC